MNHGLYQIVKHTTIQTVSECSELTRAEEFLILSGKKNAEFAETVDDV